MLLFLNSASHIKSILHCTFALRTLGRMGIQGLLPLLKSTTTPVHIKEYSGKIAAVDTYSWLHKGAITCSKELCQGLPTTKFVDYCMNRVKLLRQHGVRPLLIFDGGLLPMKEEQEIKRARSRNINLERALEHEQSGNISAAYDCYQKAVDITPHIAFQLVKVLQDEHVPYIIAPYEADAQLAFLSLQGHVDVVITEDSDAIPFGCLKVLFKMDKFGHGVEFQYNDLAKNRDLNFTSFTKQMVLEMCILSGCDYLPSLPGMGVKRAHGLIRRFRNYQKVIKHLKYNGVSVPSSYEDRFTRAVLTFRHQWVYDPVLEDIKPLTALPSDISKSLEFLGSPLSQKLGQAIARAEIDPISGLPFESKSNFLIPKMASTTGQHKRQLDLPIQKNLLTNYFLSVSTEAKRQFKAPRNNELDRNSPEVLDDCQSLTSIGHSTEILDLRTQTKSSSLCCRTSDFAFSIEEEDQVLNFLNSKMLNVESATLDASTNTRSRFQKTRGKCVVRSVYFSKDEVVGKPPVGLGTETSTTSDGISFDERCSDPLSPDLCGSRNFTHDCFDNIQKQSSQCTNGTGSQVKQGGKTIDHISVGKKKHIPIFTSKLLGDIQPGKFASDTSHVEKYATIAQKSMERFVSTIAPFHCSAPGARASGLRRPVKLGWNEKVGRSYSKATKSVEDLRQFAFTRSSCCSSLVQQESVPGVKSVVTLNDYILSERD